MRVRFTAKSPEWWEGVLQYAEDTNREPSRLIVEALDQIMARYPKRRQDAPNDVDVLAAKVAAKLGLQVPAGTSISILESSSTKNQEAKKEFGSLVHLSDSEYDKLVKDYGHKNASAFIAKLQAYKLANGRKYKSDYGAINSWVIKAVLKDGGVPEPTVAQGCSECHIGGGNHALSCSRHHENNGRPA